MREIRLFTPQDLPIGSIIELNKYASRHANQVLRLKADHTLIIFNGDGFNYKAKILETGKNTRIDILYKSENLTESPFKITLIQCISRSDRMDFTLQKATELGIFKIHPVSSQYTQSRFSGARQGKKMSRWQSIIESACEQSGRSLIPELASPKALSEYLNQSNHTGDNNFVLCQKNSEKIGNLEINGDKCNLLVGPEGGFSDPELIDIEACGFKAISLGPRILRTETAGLVAISILQSRLGDI